MRKGVTSENPRVSRVACEAAQKLVLYNLLPPEHAEEIVKALQALQQCMKGEYRSDQHECEDAEWSEEVTFEEGAL